MNHILHVQNVRRKQNIGHMRKMCAGGFAHNPTVQLKPMIKAQISGRMASIGISDVVTTSLNSEKTRMKKCMMIMIIIIIITNKSQETTVFGGCQKLTSNMKLRSKSDGRLQI